MSFIQVNLGADIKERECAPEAEYDLAIADWEIREKTYEDGGRGSVIHLFLDIENTDVRYKVIRHYLSLPRESDKKDDAETKAIMMKRFFELFSIPYSDEGFDETDIAGARGTARCTIEIDESGQYEPQNRIIIPRLKADA